MRRAAVLIGVARTGNLPELQAVASGIARMTAWAATQKISGEALVLLTDRAGKVRAHQVVDAIDKLVNKRSLEQLIVYFAGHGVFNRGDYWLLSDAPNKTAEAVNLEGSIHLARYCGIGHVVFLSDACRTAPEGIQAQGVIGTEIFPNAPVDGIERPVDVFFSCARGKPSMEIRDPKESAAKFSALYTEVLAECLTGCHLDLLERDEDGRTSEWLVRAWPMADMLQATVPPRLKRILGALPTINQTPDARITSRNAWVSRIAEDQLPKVFLEGSHTPTVLRDTSPILHTVEELFRQSGPVARRSFDEVLKREPDRGDAASALLLDTAKRLARPFGPEATESSCGFKVRGSDVRAAHSATSTHRVLNTRFGSLIEISPGGSPVNMLIEFGNGDSALLPAIPGHLAAVTFDDGELAHVDWEPAINVKLSWWNSRRTSRLHQYLRDGRRAYSAMLAAATALGVFRMRDIFQYYALDTFGNNDLAPSLYAAYAYNDVGNRGAIHAIQDRINLTICDIEMLAVSESKHQRAESRKTFTPFPMLSQGWSLLPAFAAPADDLLTTLRVKQRQSLWSLYDSSATPLLLEWVRNPENNQ